MLLMSRPSSRPRFKHVWLSSGKSTVDAVGLGLTQFGVQPTPRPSAIPLTVVDLTPMEARSLGIPDGDSLLVRPDGVPFAATGDGRWS
jgi:hypothetical protein